MINSTGNLINYNYFNSIASEKESLNPYVKQDNQVRNWK